jgi:hypothetical protein
VTIAWREEQTDVSDDGVGEPTRWTELPDVTVAAAPPADPGHSPILAKVVRAGGAVTGIEGSDRRLIGLPEAQELRADIARRITRDGAESMAGPLSIDKDLRVGGRLTNDAPSDLTIQAPATRVAGPLSIDGATAVGTRPSRSRLTVVGDVAVERGMIYTGRLDGSTATAGEVLGGVGFYGLGIQHGQLSFRAGSGFELIDRSPDAPSLDYPLGRYQFADLRAQSIFAAGNAVVGAGSNGALSVRHVNGKRPDGDAPDPLYLNWDNGQPVMVGGARPSDLHVSGGLFADSGAFNLPNGATMLTAGRQHIHTKERLYLLALDNVYVGKEWGGVGHLVVEGSVFTGANVGFGNLPDSSGGGVVAWDLFCFGGAYGKTKSFLIDHTLDPERQHLLHGSLEGPEHGVFYRGEGRVVDGTARIELPEYFEALTRPDERTVMLTPKVEPGAPVPLLGASAVRDGAFTVHADDPAAEHAFYWEVKAVRSDVDPLVVAVPKDSHESEEHDAAAHPIEA